MKRSIVVIAAALTACGGSQVLTAEEARTAMPGAQQAQVGTPPKASALTATSPTNELVAPVPVTAEYAADTINLATAVNTGVALTLGLVEFVVALPPTACSGDTCTWGPGSSAFDVNDFQLTVTKKDTADYTWALQGRPLSTPTAAFTTFVSGEAFTTGVRHVGHGTLVVDLDAAAALARKTTDPTPGTGKISATYDNTSSASVSVQFLGTADSTVPTQKVNAAYQFFASRNGSGGDLQVATRNLTTGDRLDLHSRWTVTGAGRGDASFTSGTTTYSRSQCWDGGATLFDLVFQVTSPANATDVGVESSCAFSPASPPTITVP
jgi:hypothetical protein